MADGGGGTQRAGLVITERVPRQRGRVRTLLAWQLGGLAGQVAAVCLARADHRAVAELLSDLSLAVVYGSAMWTLTVLHLSRTARNAAVVALGITPTLMWRATNPLLFTGFDEQLHMRTLGDILSSHTLFQANPLLEVSPRYPGLEVLTTLVHQLGIPAMASAFIVILICRLLLVTVLCDAVEQLTGSARAGGLAVGIYALSPQFVFFNAQFAYQTLAIPLALAAVSMIVRARRSEHPLPLLAGASVCLFAVAVTHHVTSFLTAAFLVIWTIAERRHARLWVAYGACAAIASTFIWAIVQRQLLTDYFGPIIDDVGSQLRGGERRELFKDSAGTAARSVDQYLLIYYAGMLCVMVATLLLLAYRWWRGGEHHLRWGPHFLAVVMAASIPVFLAARVVPKGGELFDRSNSFLFFPLSLLMAGYIVRLWWRDDHPHYGSAEHRRMEIMRAMTILLGAVAFLGGYVLGSGPNWARLPGPYMAAADTRSMDAETLAATKWARGALPAGSRIAADRVGSVLLAAQAGVWPVMKGPDGTDAPALYVAKNWGQAETDLAAAMQLRYLYVDRRLADEKPHFGSYFFQGETGGGQQLTARQLTKFDRVPGIEVVYRHGPVSIYDLKGLGIPELRSGWYQPTPQVRATAQVAVGLVVGLLLAAVMRGRLGTRIRQTWARSRAAWGPALTGAVVVAGACLTSVLLLLAGVWLTPLTFLSAGGVLALTHYRALRNLLRDSVSRVGPDAFKVAGLAGVSFGAIAAVAVLNAASEDIVKVRQILDDPTAIHVSSTDG